MRFIPQQLAEVLLVHAHPATILLFAVIPQGHIIRHVSDMQYLAISCIQSAYLCQTHAVKLVEHAFRKARDSRLDDVGGGCTIQRQHNLSMLYTRHQFILRTGTGNMKILSTHMQRPLRQAHQHIMSLILTQNLILLISRYSGFALR